MNLYEINKSIEDLIERMFVEVDPDTGEVDPAIIDEIEKLNIARDEKLDNIGCYIKSLDAEVNAIKYEVDVLKDRMDSKKKQIERLKEYVSSDLLNHGETKKESPRVVFSFRRSEQVNILDEDKIPSYLKTEKVEWTPDKRAIKELIKKGENVPGAELLEKQNIQIK